MEETIQIIYQTAIKQHLNIKEFLDLRSLMNNPNPTLKNNLVAAFDQLFEEGIFENVDGNPRLTEPGFIRLYGNKEEQMNLVRRVIIESTIKQNLNVNGFLDLRSLMNNPNPTLKNNLVAAFDQLFEEGIFENVDGNPRLTERGYREIWGQ